MKSMIRKLFIEPIMLPTLEGAAESDANATTIIATLAQSVMNPGAAVVPAVTNAAKMLDDIAYATPATARVLMAYISGALRRPRHFLAHTLPCRFDARYGESILARSAARGQGNHSPRCRPCFHKVLCIPTKNSSAYADSRFHWGRECVL
jgi:hypothetical protein